MRLEDALRRRRSCQSHVSFQSKPEHQVHVSTLGACVSSGFSGPLKGWDPCSPAQDHAWKMQRPATTPV